MRVVQDILPKYGLSLYRPSTLWPPPPEEAGRREREKFSNQLQSVILPHAGGGIASEAHRAGPGDTSTANNDTPTNPQPTYDGDAEGLPSTSLGDTLLPSAEKLASSSHQAGKKLSPTLSRLRDGGEAGGTEAPPPISSEDTRCSRISGQLPMDRMEPIRSQVDGQPAEINSQIQVYCM